MKKIMMLGLVSVMFVGCFLTSGDSEKGEVGQSSKEGIEGRRAWVKSLPKLYNSADYLGRVKTVKIESYEGCNGVKSLVECQNKELSKDYSVYSFGVDGAMLQERREYFSPGSEGVLGEYEDVKEFVWEGSLPISVRKVWTSKQFYGDGVLADIDTTISEKEIRWSEDETEATLYEDGEIVGIEFLSGSVADSSYYYEDYFNAPDHSGVSYRDEFSGWLSHKDYNDSLSRFVGAVKRSLEYDSLGRFIGGKASGWPCKKKNEFECDEPMYQVSAGDYDEYGNFGYWGREFPVLDSLGNATGGKNISLFKYEYTYWE